MTTQPTTTTHWTDFVLAYEGNDGRDTLRPARAVRRPDGLWVFVTEAGDGTTVTNAQAAVWRSLRRRFQDEPFRLIEHWPPGTGIDGAEHWDEMIPAEPAGGNVFWYQRWPSPDVQLFFGDTAPWSPAHKPVAQPSPRTYTALTSHMGALRRRSRHGAPGRATGSGS
ncbi:hypothetical protein [Streptomyces sp. NPDC049879]|uniref:hypothetical protein n=1 Tax=Streptomyces sp. NPDC049879 TaxID=3365598 RepID=UPI0037B98053